MSLENAESNLKEFGEELNLDNLRFDENFTCILGIDGAYSLHLTYVHASDWLYIYASLGDKLPKDDATKLKLYEALLIGSMLGSQLAGGGVGVALQEELILMHVVLPMGPGTENSALRILARSFIDCADKWRTRVEKILRGEAVDLSMESMMNLGPGGGKNNQPSPAPSAGGGGSASHYKKI